jgi:Cu/Ag efflux pump CusA
MTLTEAFKHFLQSDAFKSVAKAKDSQGGKYRMYESRFNKDELGEKIIIKLLTENGYKIKKEINVTLPNVKEQKPTNVLIKGMKGHQ